MAQIVLTVDTSQAKQALNSVNQAITQIQVNGQNISIGGQKVAGQFKQMGQAAQKAGQQIGDSVQKEQKRLAKTMKGVTNQFNSQIGKIRGFATGMVSYWTAIIVAVEMATKTFTYFFNNLTESTTKMTTRGQNAIKVAQLANKKVQQETKEATELIKKIEDLNKLQNLSIEQQRLAQSIVSKLNKQYKDLNITIDQTTGKYQGLYQAQIKIDQRSKNSQANALRQQITAQRDVINAALKNAGLNFGLGQKINGNQLFTFAEQLGGTFGAQNSGLLAQKWNTGDINKQIEVIDQLINGLSTSNQFMQNGQAVRDAMQALIDYKKQLQDLNSVDTLIQESTDRLTQSLKQQRDALKATKDQIDKINQSYEDQQRTNSLAGLDPEDRANALRAEVEQLKRRNEELDKAKTIGEKELSKKQADSYSDLIDFDYLSDKLKEYSKKVEKEQDKIAKKRQNISRLIEKANGIQTWEAVGGVVMEIPEAVAKQNALYKEAEDEQKRISQIQKELVSDQKILNQLKQEFSKQEATYQEHQSAILKNEQAIADLDKQRAQNLNTIQSKEKQIAEIEKQLAKEKADAELKAWQLEQQRIKNYSNFVDDLMKRQIEGINEILGNKKDNLLLELQINAEKIRGRKLTEDQVKALKSYVDVMGAQDQFKENQKLNFQTNGVISNDIARKGGWASSVVVDRAQDINKQILNVQKSQVEFLAKLNETMDKSNELLKQFSVIQ